MVYYGSGDDCSYGIKKIVVFRASCFVFNDAVQRLTGKCEGYACCLRDEVIAIRQASIAKRAFIPLFRVSFVNMQIVF